jgi:hypothetical protein
VAQAVGFRKRDGTALQVPPDQDLGWRFAVSFRDPLQDRLAEPLAAGQRAIGLDHDFLLSRVAQYALAETERTPGDLVDGGDLARLLDRGIDPLRGIIADPNVACQAFVAGTDQARPNRP